MKLWIDDERPAPDGYIWLRSVEEAKIYIGVAELKELMTKEIVSSTLAAKFKIFKMHM